MLLSEKEDTAARDFRWGHNCKARNSDRVLQITLTPTGIADGVEVKCMACGLSKSVTDITSW